ncbi:Uncharacterised protein [Bordetella pertussis]|nr:Uncharacterised protein [Bordetella pertussis]CFO79593.1 Uncharacterised protein [Bordetella pertussis]CFU86387.1 Uncharacterised protein [Bordetella pertussis]CPI46042.1 Uncharacterised protein [Bordetella pertussis]CPM39757.1 Uncharacterised protein [Bordetella pertussis]
MTNSASGRPFMSLMPPIDLFSLSSSRWNSRPSFLVMRSKPPSATMASMSFRRLIELLTVLKLVSMPPSQRAST